MCDANYSRMMQRSREHALSAEEAGKLGLIQLSRDHTIKSNAANAAAGYYKKLVESKKILNRKEADLNSCHIPSNANASFLSNFGEEK